MAKLTPREKFLKKFSTAEPIEPKPTLVFASITPADVNDYLPPWMRKKLSDQQASASAQTIELPIRKPDFLRQKKNSPTSLSLQRVKKNKSKKRTAATTPAARKIKTRKPRSPKHIQKRKFEKQFASNNIWPGQ